MCDTTKHPKGVTAGTVRFVGVVSKKVGSVSELLSDEDANAKVAEARNPYGDPTPAVRIVDAIVKHFQQRADGSPSLDRPHCLEVASKEITTPDTFRY